MKLSALDEHRSVHFTYYDPTLQPQIFQHFQSCRLGDRFIDLEVEVEGVIFPCHQILLDAFCPFFAAYFSFHERKSAGNWNEQDGSGESPTGRERVSLKYSGVTVNGFARLLDFIYTAELEVTSNDVIDVLRCADFLQFHQVVYLCSAFLQQHITTDTCLQVLMLAQAHDLYDLAQNAFDFILSNLTDVIYRDEFTQLPKDLLVKIISNPRLELETEATIVEAVLLWVRASKRHRNPALEELLQYARLRSIDLQLLGKDVLLKSSDVLGPKGEDGDFMLSSALGSLTVSALPDRLTEVLVVVCRETEFKHRGMIRNLSTVYYYDPEALRWEILTRIPYENRQDYSATAVNNILYLTGGQNLDTYDIFCTKIIFNENWAYDPLNDKWEEKRSMLVPRYNHSAAGMLDKLYVVGGRASSSSYSLRADGEVYDPAIDQWTMISPVCGIEGIANAAMTSLDGKLYIVGGTYFMADRRSHVPYDNHRGAQVYNPKENLWQELLPLEREIAQRKIHVSRGGAVSVDGFLLLLDDNVGKSHQLYNPVTQTLVSLVQAHGHHWFAGWAVFQGQLVCTGGLEDGRSGRTDMVHAWDFTKQHQGWRMLPPLPRAMSHHACLNMYLNLPRPGTEELAPDPHA